MANDKKGFVLYADLIHTVRKLKSKDAGELLLHILQYVNDENPETKNPIVDLAFEPIKQQLKRDLKKYEGIKEKRREIGRAGGLKSGEERSKTKQNEAIASKSKQTQANEAVIVTDTVKDKVTDTVTDTERLKEKPHDIFPNETFKIDPSVLKNSSHVDRIGMNNGIDKEKMKTLVDGFLKERENDQRKYRGMPGLLNHFTEYCNENKNKPQITNGNTLARIIT